MQTNSMTTTTLTSTIRKNTALFHLNRLLLALVFTGITGLAAQVRFYLPFTPVPVTGQVFAVLLGGALLGKEYGSLSQLAYVVFGLAGVPWFVLGPAGPTWGYLIGFILAPYAIGFFRERASAVNPGVTLLSMTCGLALIYLLGFVHFHLYTNMGFARAFMLSVLPFLPFDVAKALLATAVVHLLLRKTRLFPV
jgi:biotin transport system substrate-specific component